MAALCVELRYGHTAGSVGGAADGRPRLPHMGAAGDRAGMDREKSNWRMISKPLALIRGNPDQYIKEYRACYEGHRQ